MGFFCLAVDCSGSAGPSVGENVLLKLVLTKIKRHVLVLSSCHV